MTESPTKAFSYANPYRKDAIVRFLILILSILSPLTTQGPAMATSATPPFAAHRGDHMSGYAEESLAAMVSAIQKGATWIDMDARPSKDGVLFLHHDGGYVENRNSLWLRQHGVPTLSAVLRGTKQYPNIGAFVEIKSAHSDTYSRAVKIFKDFGISRITVSSYSRATLNNYRKVYPAGKVTLNTMVAHPPEYYKNYGSASIDMTIATPTYIASLKNAGVPVFVFTPNTQAEWSTIPSNVDGIFTDYIDAYKSYESSKAA